MNSKARLAIVGSGISGLGTALELKDLYDIDLYESASQWGGHIRPRSVPLDGGGEVSIDTAFLGFKPEVYPSVTKLFEKLGVETIPCAITGSVHLPEQGYRFLRHEAHLQFGKTLPMEWAQPSRTFFASLTQALQPGFQQLPNIRLDDYLKSVGVPEDMAWTLIIPDVASIWGVQAEEAAAMSVHGAVGSLLTVGKGVHRLKNTTADYLKKLLAACRFQNTYLQATQLQVSINSQRKPQILHEGTLKTYDRVLIATSAEQALRLLVHSTEEQKRLLSAFNYVSTVAILHHDPALLNEMGSCRGHFNYVKMKDTVAITWDMSSLMGLTNKEPVQITTSHPRLLSAGVIDESKIWDVAVHRHCIPSPASVAAIPGMMELNKKGPLHFSGSYFSPAATHEAAMQSARKVSQILQQVLKG